MPLDFLSYPERIRYQSVPSSILESDLRLYFHLTLADQRFLLSFRAVNRLGVALQLGIIRFMGYLPEGWLQQVSGDIIHFVAQQLNPSPHKQPLSIQRPNTRTGHLLTILTHLAFRRWEPLDATWLEVWLLERALEHDDERLLLAMTCQKLRQQKILRPAITTLERLIGSMNELAHQETFRRVQFLLTDPLKRQLDELLTVDSALQISRHRWLIQPAVTNNPLAVNNTIDKLKFLDKLGVIHWNLTHLPLNRRKRLTLIARSRSNRYLERLPDYKRYSILLVFLRESWYTLTDDVLTMYDGYWEHSLARARRAYEEYQQRVAANKDRALQQMGKVVSIVLDEEQVPAELVRSAVYDQISREDLRLAWEAVESLLFPTRHSQLTFLAHRYSLFKQFTPNLLSQIQFQHGFQEDDFPAALQLLIDLQSGKRRKLATPVPLQFVKPSWKKFILMETGELERKSYELCILATLRDRLRSGDVFVELSYQYADLNSYLIPPSEWKSLRLEIGQQLNLPLLFTERIDQRIDELEALLRPMHELLVEGAAIRLDEEGLVVGRLTAEDVPPEAKALQAEISRRMPVVDLTDILVEVNTWLGFTDELIGLEHASRNEQHTTLLLASILATGCNIPLSDMARSSGLSYQSIWWTSMNYLRDETLKATNTIIVNEHHRQWLSAYWGDGSFSSSDGQRFPVSGKVRNARALPNYFGPGKGVTMQTHTSDQYSQYGSKVVAATLRDATIVLDEIIGNQTDLRIVEHTTDTAGYTDIIFALFDLLGLNFSPRLRDIADQKLSKIKGKDWLYPDLKFTGTVNPDYLHQHFEELTRLAGSIHSGRVTASLFIGKLQAYPRQHNLTYVLQAYGQLIKTIFILRYLQSQPLRRRIHAQLNKGEELHALRAWLWFGSDGTIRRKQVENQNESARCLTLLTNKVLLWNTVYMQEVLQQLQQEGYPVDEACFEYLSPCRYEHINRLGKYSFTESSPYNLTNRRPLRNKQSDKL